MPLDLDHDGLTIQILPNTLHLFKVDRSRWDFADSAPTTKDPFPFYNVITTPDETSIMTSRSMEKILNVQAGTIEGPYRYFRLKGPLDLSMIGVMARLTAVLEVAKVSLMAMSSYNTDYVAIKQDVFDNAIAALQLAGWNTKDYAP